MKTNVELFNDHQRDTRHRMDFLTKAVLALASGSLTVSFGVFIGKDDLKVDPAILWQLKASWWLLFVLIIALVLALWFVLIRDYFLGEKWRKKLAGFISGEITRAVAWDVTIWIFGVLGLGSFLTGMIMLACFSTNAITTIFIP